LIVPVLYLLLDVQAVHAHVTDAMNHVFPYFFIQIVAIAWLTRRRVLPLLADLSQLLCAVEIVRSVFAGLIRPKGHKFKVTAKGGDRSREFVQWPILRVFMYFIWFTAAGIIWAFVLDDTRPLADSSALALFWSWYNLIVLTLACFVTIESQQRRAGERLQASDMCWVAAADRNQLCRVFDISTSGIAFHGESPVPSEAIVSVRVGSMDVPGVVVRASGGSFAVNFIHTEKTRLHLIRYVFSGRHKTGTGRIKPANVAVGILSRLYR
jgi:cellulose synthase (UDP-forming)